MTIFRCARCNQELYVISIRLAGSKYVCPCCGHDRYDVLMEGAKIPKEVIDYYNELQKGAK